MSVADLLNERAELKAHRWFFRLWPRQWAAYNLPDSFNWEIYPFQHAQIENIPSQPGIYSFVIQPGIASHFHCSYLMYIGKTGRTLRERFREYFRERNYPESRPKILEMLNRYEGYLHFCCLAIEEKEQITEIEEALISAFLPPCNDQLPANIRRIAGAF